MVARTPLIDPAAYSRKRFVAAVTLLFPLSFLILLLSVAKVAGVVAPDTAPPVVNGPKPAPLVPVVAAVEQAAELIPVSATPSVIVRGGTPKQHERLDMALARFADAGLLLPDLEIVFAATDDACRGNIGLFEDEFTPWRVSICSQLEFVYEHELAHAWEAATLTADQRQEFMALRGRSVWADHSVPWKERGIEDAAFIVQQALSGSRLPAKLSDERLSRLHAFELLTGSPDPRLTDWEARMEQRSGA